MSGAFILSDGVEIIVDGPAGALAEVDPEGITNTSARLNRALEKAARAITASDVGQTIARMASDLADSVREHSSVGSEYEISFGLVLGSEVDLKVASSAAEASISVTVRFTLDA
jgi:hypothetical protein